jgi:hypothetical protein
VVTVVAVVVAIRADASLLPLFASLGGTQQRQSSELQAWLLQRTLALMQFAFPRLGTPFLRRHLRDKHWETLLLLSSDSEGADASGSGSGDLAALSARRRVRQSKAKPTDAADADSDPFEVLDEGSDDVVRVAALCGVRRLCLRCRNVFDCLALQDDDDANEETDSSASEEGSDDDDDDEDDDEEEEEEEKETSLGEVGGGGVGGGATLLRCHVVCQWTDPRWLQRRSSGTPTSAGRPSPTSSKRF